jgi:hypothetical protein
MALALSVIIMLNVTFCYYAECHYAECHHAEGHLAEYCGAYVKAYQR